MQLHKINGAINIRLTFAAVLALVTGSIAVSYLVGLRAIAHEQSVAFERLSINRLDQVFSTLQEVETGQRGFIITGDESYLEPYSKGLEQLVLRRSQMKDLANGGYLPEAAVIELNKLIDLKLEEAASTIEQRRKGGLEYALPVVRTHEGKRIMDRIRTTLETMRESERVEMMEAEESARQALVLRKAVFALMVLLNIVALVWAYSRTIAAIRERDRAEEALRRQAELIDLRPVTPVRPAMAWLFPFAAVGAAAAVRYLLEPWVGFNIPFGLFFLAVTVTALYTGFAQAVLATVLSAMATAYLFMEPQFSLLVPGETNQAALILFVLVSMAIATLGLQFQRSRGKTEASIKVLRRQAALIDQSPDAIIVRLVDGTIKSWSRGAEKLYGWKRAEAVGKLSHRLLHTVFPEPLESIELRMDRGEDWRGELIHRARDGREVIVSSFWHAERIDGELEILESNIDLSEIKRGEKAQAQLAAIIESSDDAIISKDLHGTILTWNASAERLFGYRPEEAVGRSITILVPGERKQEEERIFNRLGRGERIEHYETVRVAKDGRHIEVSLTVSPLKDKTGKVVGASSIVRDITGRKESEEALKKSERRYRSFVEVTNQFAWITNARGEVEEDVPSFRGYLGLTCEEIRGDGWARALHPDDVEQTLKTWKNCVTTGRTYEIEYRLRRHDGVYRLLQVRGVPIRNDDGSIIEWVGTCIDITEQREAEEARKLSEERYSRFVTASSQTIWRVNENGEIEEDNEDWCEYTGQTFEEARGFGWTNAIAVTDKERVFAAWNEAVRSRKLYEVDYSLRVADGSYREVLARGVPIFRKDGTVREWVGVCIYITDRKRAETALAESHQRLKRVLEVETVGVMFWDLTTGRMTDANDAFLKMMGYSRSQVEAGELTWQKLTPPEFHDASWTEIGKFQATGRVGPYEKEYFRADGSRQWLVFAGSSIGSNACVEFCVDIADRKKAEQALRESEERLKLITGALEAAANGILITDRSGKIIWVNHAFTKLTGYSFEEAVGLNPSVLKSGEQTDGFFKSLWETILNGQVWRGELINRRKDLSRYHESMTITPVLSSSGEVTHFIAIKEDITAKKEAEQALKESERRLRTLFDSNVVGIVFYEMDGRITEANDRFLSMVGYSRQELAENRIDWKSMTPPEFKRLDDSSVEELKTRGANLSPYEKEYIRKDGSRVPVLLGSATLDEKRSRGVSFVVDISDRKRAEKDRAELITQVQRAQRLESIGILAGGIAHDFNNLLAGLFGYIELGRMQADRGTYAKVTSTLDKAMSVLDHAKSLTQQLLTFSKGGAPAMSVEDVSRPLREAAAFALSGSNVHTLFDFQENLWPCKIDTNQFRQAIDNILINAKEAMTGGGRIIVSAENMPDDGHLSTKSLARGNYVRIKISDQGPGIPADAIEHIFDPFFTTKEKGHGLGLSIAYSVVRKHGGTIEFETKPGKGTTFCIYLPASSEQVNPAEVQSAGAKWTRRPGQVLVMDDEEIIQEVVGEMLTGLGYTVAFAFNGEEAIRLYKEAFESGRPFDAVILDLTIRTGFGGKETIIRLKEIDPEVVAIVSSGYSNDPVMAYPESYGFRKALMKPYQSKDLDDVLNEIAGERKIPRLRVV